MPPTIVKALTLLLAGLELAQSPSLAARLSASAAVQEANRWRSLGDAPADAETRKIAWQWADSQTARYLVHYFRPVLFTYGDPASPFYNPISATDFVSLCRSYSGGGGLTPKRIIESSTGGDGLSEHEKYFIALADDWQARLAAARQGEAAHLPDHGKPVIYCRVWQLAGTNVFSVLLAALFPYNAGRDPWPLPMHLHDHEGDWLAADLHVRYDPSNPTQTPDLIGVYSHSHGRQFYTSADRLVDSTSGKPRFLSREQQKRIELELGAGVHLPLFCEQGRGEWWPYPGGAGTKGISSQMSVCTGIEKKLAWQWVRITDSEQSAAHNGTNLIYRPLHVRLLSSEHLGTNAYPAEAWEAWKLTGFVDALLVARFAGRWGGSADSPTSPRFQSAMWTRSFKPMSCIYPDDARGNAMEWLTRIALLSAGAAVLGATIGAVVGAAMAGSVAAAGTAGALTGLALAATVAVVSILILAALRKWSDASLEPSRTSGRPWAALGQHRPEGARGSAIPADGSTLELEEESGPPKGWDGTRKSLPPLGNGKFREN